MIFLNSLRTASPLSNSLTPAQEAEATYKLMPIVTDIEQSIQYQRDYDIRHTILFRNGTTATTSDNVETKYSLSFDKTTGLWSIYSQR